jgi:hypothetical protein
LGWELLIDRTDLFGGERMSDIRRSSYTSGVVHTHSGYAKGNINKEFISTLANGKSGVEGKIAALKAKE